MRQSRDIRLLSYVMGNVKLPEAERLFKIAGQLFGCYCTVRALMLQLDPILGADSPEWRNLERSVQRDLSEKLEESAGLGDFVALLGSTLGDLLTDEDGPVALQITLCD